MKNTFLFLLLSLLLTCCAAPKKTSNMTLINTLIGQNEMVVLKSLGAPTTVTHASDGGKIMVYAHVSDSATPGTPSTSTQNSSDNNRYSSPMGITYTGKSASASGTNTSGYQKNIKALKVHVNNLGNCFRIENTLPQAQLDIYNKRLKEKR